MRTIQDLKVFRKAMELSEAVQTATEHFPKNETTRLVDQMRRAGISVVSNIAEGSKRTPAGNRYFLQIAHASAAELESQILMAHKFKYTSPDEDRSLRNLADHVSRLIFLYRKSIPDT